MCKFPQNGKPVLGRPDFGSTGEKRVDPLAPENGPPPAGRSTASGLTGLTAGSDRSEACCPGTDTFWKLDNWGRVQSISRGSFHYTMSVVKGVISLHYRT